MLSMRIKKPQVLVDGSPPGTILRHHVEAPLTWCLAGEVIFMRLKRSGVDVHAS